MKPFILTIALSLSVAFSANTDWINVIGVDSVGGICVGRSNFDWDLSPDPSFILLDSQKILLEAWESKGQNLGNYACQSPGSDWTQHPMAALSGPSDLAFSFPVWWLFSIQHDMQEYLESKDPVMLHFTGGGLDFAYDQPKGHGVLTQSPGHYWIALSYEGVTSTALSDHVLKECTHIDYYECNNITSFPANKYSWIVSMAADARGRIWIGTAYDTVFTRAADSTWTSHDLGWPAVEIVARDSDWVEFFGSSTRKMGVLVAENRAQWKNGTFTQLNDDSTSIIRCPKPGHCWVVQQSMTSDTAVIYLEEKGVRTKSIPVDTLILELAEDHEGTLWVGTLKGLLSIDTASGAVSEVTPVGVLTSRAPSTRNQQSFTRVQGLWVNSPLQVQVPGPGVVQVFNLQGRLLASRQTTQTQVVFSDLPVQGLVSIRYTALPR